MVLPAVVAAVLAMGPAALRAGRKVAAKNAVAAAGRSVQPRAKAKNAATAGRTRFGRGLAAKRTLCTFAALEPVLKEARGAPSRFGERTYWEEFYRRKVGDDGAPQLGAKADGTFEWFLDPADVVEECVRALGEVEDDDGAILHVGCGTSALGIELARATGRDVVNVDNSSEAIAAMHAAAAAGKHNVEGAGGECLWEERDGTALPAEWAGRFSLIVDKGTLDALAFAGASHAAALCAEMDRVLTPRGRLLFITDEVPEQRVDLLRACLPAFAHTFRSMDDVREDWEYYVYKSQRSPATSGGTLWSRSSP